MKKIFLLVTMIIALITTSCKQEYDNWFSEAYELSGDWTVTADAIDAAGNVVYEDLFGIGQFLLTTYSTANNNGKEMWVDDNFHFWEFKIKTNIDVNAKTFNVDNANNTSYEGCLVTIKDGKVIPGVANIPSGVKADSIVFTVSFSDDTNPAKYGYDAYRISGFRKTGFAEDDPH